MSLDGAYDVDNPFARILRSELPCAKICEDSRTLAFLDLFPQSLGHALVISKVSKARNLLEVEEDALADIAVTVQRVARALRKTLEPDGLHIAQFNGGDTGQSVFHLHFHVIPRWKDKPLGILEYHGASAQAKLTELQLLAARIQANLV